MRLGLLAASFLMMGFTVSAQASALPCSPTKTYAQAIADYNTATASAMARYNETIAAATADMHADHAAAETALQAVLNSPRAGDPDKSADELNLAYIEYSRSIDAANQAFNQRAALAVDEYNSTVASAVMDYDRSLCRVPGGR